MKIEEAIEILQKLTLPIKAEQDHRQHQAVRLGIEALKRIKVEREHFSMSLVLYIGAPLPGESEE